MVGNESYAGLFTIGFLVGVGLGKCLMWLCKLNQWR